MGLYDNLGDKLLCARAGSYKSCFMNRQLGVGDSKYVLVFDPLFTGHVIRRLRSGRVRIFSANQGNRYDSSNLVAGLCT